jgi:hypothetical protein
VDALMREVVEVARERAAAGGNAPAGGAGGRADGAGQ